MHQMPGDPTVIRFKEEPQPKRMAQKDDDDLTFLGDLPDTRPGWVGRLEENSQGEDPLARLRAITRRS